MSVVVLDTDAASLLQRGRLEPAVARHLKGATLALTFVTLGELHKGVALRNWGDRRRADLAAWLDQFLVLPYSEGVARRWGELSAGAQKRGRPRPVNDTWIAACCLVHETPLVTLNRTDFADFADHEGLRLLGNE